MKKKTGWTSPRDWIQDKRIRDILLDIFPTENKYGILWKKIRSEMISNKNLIMNRSLYPIISLAILLRKYGF